MFLHDLFSFIGFWQKCLRSDSAHSSVYYFRRHMKPICSVTGDVKTLIFWIRCLSGFPLKSFFKFFAGFSIHLHNHGLDLMQGAWLSDILRFTQFNFILWYFYIKFFKKNTKRLFLYIRFCGMYNITLQSTHMHVYD